MSVGRASILLQEPERATANALSDTLILNGFTPRIVESHEELLSLLQTGLFRILVADIAPDRQEFAERVHAIRASEEFRFLQVLWMLDRATRDMVMELVELGYTQFLAKPVGTIQFAEKMRDWTDHILGGPSERRQHVRIQLPNYENAKLILTLQGGRKVISRISNLSVGGMFIQWNTEQGLTRLNIGERSTNALLLIGNLDLFVDVQVMAITEEGLGLKFIHLDERKLRSICGLIYDRIQQENLHAH